MTKKEKKYIELLRWFCEFTEGFENHEGVPIEDLDEWIEAKKLSKGFNE